MIVDASAAVPVLVEQALTRQARSVLVGRRLVGPAILLTETANALWKYSIKGGMTADQINAAIRHIRAIIHTVPDEDVMAQAVQLAVAYRHPVYDCLYLALALERRAALATADRRMAALAQELSIPIELIEPEA